MIPEQYADLKTELLAGHPISGVYNADDFLAATQINVVDITVNKNTTPQEAADATDAGEFNLLSDADKSLWVSMLSWETINLNAGIGLATAQGIWAGAAGTITRPALIATTTELVSRATELNFGTVIIGDIQNARAL